MLPVPQTCSACGRINDPTAIYCGHCGVCIGISESPINVALPINDLPAGFRLGNHGRYQIERLIGRGGFGETYLAQDIDDRRLCIVKRPRATVWADATALQSFDSEARALAQLNIPGHAHIPFIYDYLAEYHALVMQYIDGQDLRSLIEQRLAPISEIQALQFMGAIGSALVYMHSQQPVPVLHRDLKPENILLDHYGQVWVIDFGLAKSVSSPTAHAPPDTTMIGGTRGYTPPEQWHGDAEPRSDVYALAATLCALLIGRNPAPSAEKSLHLLHQRRPDLHPQLGRLIAWGMAEALAERPSAQHFLDAAETLLHDMLAATRPSSALLPAHNLCVGRSSDLENARDHFERQSYVMISGSDGIGKTTLAIRLAQEYSAQRPVFWYRFCAYAPTDLLWELANFLAQHGFPDTWQQLQIERAASSIPLVASNRTLFTDEQILDRLLYDLQGQNALICLDAIPGEDQRVARFCARLVEMAGDGALALIITAAQVPEFAHSWAQVPLAGVQADAAHALLASRAGGLSNDHGTELARRTGGNPQLLLLVADLLMRQAVDPATLIARLTASPAPDVTILQILDACLDTNERDVLLAVAVLLDTGGTSGVIGTMIQCDHLSDTLASLSARSLLHRYPSAEGTIYALPPMLWAFYYDGMDRAQRRAMHRCAAAYYELEASDVLRAVLHLDRAGDHVRAARLAAQIERAIGRGATISSLGSAYAQLVLEQLRTGELGPGERASVCTVQGEIAARLGDYQLAEAQLKHAISLGAAGETTAQANRYVHLASVYERLGNYKQAEACCADGLAIIGQVAGSSVEAARLALLRAELLFRQSQYDQAAEVCINGLQALPPAPEAADLRVALRHRLVTIRGDQGHYADAINQLEALLPEARDVSDPALTAAVLNNLGRYCQDIGRLDRAREYHHESLRIKEQIGDVAGQAVALMNLGRLYISEGELVDAVIWFREALRRSKQRGLKGWQALTLLNLGQVHLELSEFVHADESFSSAQQLYKQLGDSSRIAHCLYLRGDVALAGGDITAAYTYGCQALEQARQIGSVAFESCALRVIGEAESARGALALAAEHLARAATLQEQVQDPYDQALIWAAQARLAEIQSDSDQALHYARASLRLARAQHVAPVIAAMESLIRRHDSAQAREG